jgi:hypothetical protein
MSQAFQERLLNILSTLKAAPAANSPPPLPVLQPTVSQVVPVNLPSVNEFHFIPVKEAQASGVPWLLLISLVLAGCGLGIAITALIYERKQKKEQTIKKR